MLPEGLHVELLGDRGHLDDSALDHPPVEFGVVDLLAKEPPAVEMAVRFVLRLAAPMGRDLVNTASAKDASEAMHRQNIHPVVGRRGDEPADSAEVHLVEQVLGEDALVVGGYARHAGRGEITAVRIHHQYAEALLLDHLGDGPTPGVRTHEQESLWVRVGELEPARRHGSDDRREEHRADDDEERHRHEQSRLLKALGAHA